MSECRLFSRYVLPFMASNMYVRIEAGEALVVDPQPAEAVCAALVSAGVGRVLILLTHEHFDHTSGVNFFRRRFPEVRVLAHERTAQTIASACHNRPLSLLKMVTEENRAEILAAYRAYRMEPIAVDAHLTDGAEIAWRDHGISVQEAPGHSPGSVLLHFDDAAMFTGDYLIWQTPVILRYPGGSEAAYESVTLPKLKTIACARYILPGHGEPYAFDARQVDWNQRR